MVILYARRLTGRAEDSPGQVSNHIDSPVNSNYPFVYILIPTHQYYNIYPISDKKPYCPSSGCTVSLCHHTCLCLVHGVLSTHSHPPSPLPLPNPLFHPITTPRHALHTHPPHYPAPRGHQHIITVQSENNMTKGNKTGNVIRRNIT